MLKNFFSGYSQNGAAQAIVVLSAFTVAAEVIRTRSTGKRPYRDYGVGGMNEPGHGYDHDDMYPTHQGVGVPHDWRETMAHGMDVEARDYGYPMDMDMGTDMDMDVGHDDDHMDAWAEMQAVRQQSRRSAAQGQSWSEGARQQVGRQQVGRQQASRQQVSRQQAHMQREDVEGSMAREASPWNRYVATEVPRLMAKGMTAPEAMKAASKSFRRRS